MGGGEPSPLEAIDREGGHPVAVGRRELEDRSLRFCCALPACARRAPFCRLIARLAAPRPLVESEPREARGTTRAITARTESTGNTAHRELNTHRARSSLLRLSLGYPGELLLLEGLTIIRLSFAAHPPPRPFPSLVDDALPTTSLVDGILAHAAALTATNPPAESAPVTLPPIRPTPSTAAVTNNAGSDSPMTNAFGLSHAASAGVLSPPAVSNRPSRIAPMRASSSMPAPIANTSPAASPSSAATASSRTAPPSSAALPAASPGGGIHTRIPLANAEASQPQPARDGVAGSGAGSPAAARPSRPSLVLPATPASMSRRSGYPPGSAVTGGEQLLRTVEGGSDADISAATRSAAPKQVQPPPPSSPPPPSPQGDADSEGPLPRVEDEEHPPPGTRTPVALVAPSFPLRSPPASPPSAGGHPHADIGSPGVQVGDMPGPSAARAPSRLAATLPGLTGPGGVGARLPPAPMTPPPARLAPHVRGARTGPVAATAPASSAVSSSQGIPGLPGGADTTPASATASGLTWRGGASGGPVSATCSARGPFFHTLPPSGTTAPPPDRAPTGSASGAADSDEFEEVVELQRLPVVERRANTHIHPGDGIGAGSGDVGAEGDGGSGGGGSALPGRLTAFMPPPAQPRPGTAPAGPGSIAGTGATTPLMPRLPAAPGPGVAAAGLARSGRATATPLETALPSSPLARSALGAAQVGTGTARRGGSAGMRINTGAALRTVGGGGSGAGDGDEEDECGSAGGADGGDVGGNALPERRRERVRRGHSSGPGGRHGDGGGYVHGGGSDDEGDDECGDEEGECGHGRGHGRMAAAPGRRGAVGGRRLGAGEEGGGEAAESGERADDAETYGRGLRGLPPFLALLQIRPLFAHPTEPRNARAHVTGSES